MSMSKRTLESLTNAGYEIIMMEEFAPEEHLGIALGRKPASFPQQTGEEYQYVTWEYRNEPYDKKPSFFWGHYIMYKAAAYVDYHERLMRNYQYQVERRTGDEG